MQKAISKYGLAAHLALLAVAPLFLFPFCGDEWIGHALLWLSLQSFLWILMEPSRRQGEMLHDARYRVFTSIFKDPLFWFSLVLVAIAFVRWQNGGVGMAYDAENSVWSLAQPSLPFLPGSRTGSGYLPFVVVVAVSVLMQGGRHALGKSARGCFLFIASTLAGFAAIIATVSAACGHVGALAATECQMTDASFAGNGFGLHLAGAMVALVIAFDRKWKRAMPLMIVAVAGCGVGLYVFSPDFVIVAYAAAAVLSLVFSLVYAQRKVGGLVAPKCLSILLISVAAGVVLTMGVVPASVKEARFAFLSQENWKLLSDDFMAARESLSSIALAVFKEHAWLGTGLGSFGLDIRFQATDADWTRFVSAQQGALNGWWQLIAERGISGAIFFVSPLFFLLWTYVLRAVEAVRRLFVAGRLGDVTAFQPTCALGPIVLAATVACGFIDHSFWRPETMMAVATVFAMSGSSFPAASSQGGAEAKTEK